MYRGLGKSAQLCVHYGSIARFENSVQLQKRRRILRMGRPLPPLVYPLLLLACPATVLQHWLDEFHHWAPHLRVVLLHSISDSFSQLQGALGAQGVYRALNRIARARAADGEGAEHGGAGSEGGLDANVDVHSGVVCITTYEGLRRLAPEVSAPPPLQSPFSVSSFHPFRLASKYVWRVSCECSCVGVLLVWSSR